jgi:DNA polymerase I-like protein with 3'-5' exonuclease and polymerase domains
VSVIAFDTETWLIAPGLLAPPIVCLQWAFRTAPGEAPGWCCAQMRHRDDGAYERIKTWLEGDGLLVGHNVAYDMGVIAAQWPDLLPLIFAKYDRDQVTDTLLREQLIMIARGTFRSQMDADGEIHPVKYNLDDCCARHFGRRLKKEGWRLFYRVFDEVPDITDWSTYANEFQLQGRRGKWPEWVHDCLDAGIFEKKAIDAVLAAPPEEAREYALEDGRTTLALYESQEKHFAPLLKDQFRQARAAFALHLTSAWGLYTDPDAVDKLETELRADFDALKFELQQELIIREDGTADTKKAKEAMVAACEEEGFPVARTKGGDVSLSAEACERFDETSVIGRYSQFLTLRKTLSNDIKMLRAGCDYPVQARYDIADTGRSRASKPNIQAINRGAGIREAFRPRPGALFIQADFEGLELHTRAAWCLEKIGWSKLADDLNAKLDVHSVVAADLLGMTYDEVKAGLKSKDPELKKKCKDARQSAKALNFGLPGGLGAKKFIRYARTNYGVDLTEEQAKQYKAQWMRRQPEMVEFFALAARATANPAKLGDEESLFTERLSTNMRYSKLCNIRFQGLGACAAKEALWRVCRACYVETESPLYGCRPVAFIHDEVIAECADDHRAAPAAKELGRLMCEGANKYLHRVPVRTEPLIMRVWSKSAEPVYAEDGSLRPWAPAEAA